jgi:hypothetical protein
MRRARELVNPESFSDAVELPPEEAGCRVMQLPERLLESAADLAWRMNPVNSPRVRGASSLPDGVLTASFAAVLTTKYWGPTPRTLTVSFLDPAGADLRARILSHMNAWTKTGCIKFVEKPKDGNVRISFGPGGYWSYLGTDIGVIPKNMPTMNLQGFSMSTSESEFKRVVRHETGHTLGMPHEHMRKALVELIDPQKAYDFFLKTYGWNKKMVDEQVLTSLNEATLISTPADEDSIMCYQLPGSITRNGDPINGGLDINASDYAFVAKIYPKPKSALQPAASTRRAAMDWATSDDVDLDEAAASFM